MQLPVIVLKRGKERSIQRKHPWVFSGAIHKIINPTMQEPDEGELVQVVDNNNTFLGLGFFQDATIAVRIISFKDVAIDQHFWDTKINTAFQLRQQINLSNTSETNIYRLIHAEGDGIPGLIIDFYNGTAVIQAHNKGIYDQLDFISEALKKVYQNNLIAVYNKSAEALSKQTSLTNIENSYLYENGTPELIGKENNHQFHLDWVDGQKTGFFIDQRENRRLLGKYANNKKVLNTYCYSGGFSVYALKSGAKEVHSVDSSQKAIDLTDQNIALNQLKNHKSFAIDTMDFLKQNKTTYDIIVLDPPAFAKRQKAKHNAVQGYKRINKLALQQIKPGGILFTFSCSQAVNRKLFTDTVTAAAIEVGRDVKILHHLSQPADHPINIYHPEGEYLKGLVLYVE